MTRKSAPMALVLAITFLLAACAGSLPRQASATGNTTPASVDAAGAADHAYSMVGAPYRYGGIDPTGFDCSGLVNYSFRQIGIALPRDTYRLREVGTEVGLDELVKGDLLFFDQEGKKSSHVGIYLGDGRFVHAPSTGGKVRADKLDLTYWRKHFNEARRIRI